MTLEMHENNQRIHSGGFRGILHRLAPAWVPIVLNQESDFIRILKQRMNEGKSVEIEVRPAIVIEKKSKKESTAKTNTEAYYVISHATVGNKEKIQFERRLFEHAAPDHPSFNIEEGQKAGVMGLMAAELQESRLRFAMPDARIEWSGQGGPFNEDERVQLHRLAEEAGIDQAEVEELFSGQERD